MAFITINKLFEKLPEDELKAVQLYFDEKIVDKFPKYKINVKVLFLSLVYKNGTQKLMNYKEFRELFPQAEWLSIPKKSFNEDTLTNPKSKRLMKVYIRAERTQFKSSFCHQCIVKDVDDQSKLTKFQNERSESKAQIIKDFVRGSESLESSIKINEDDIDPDMF